MGCLKLTYDEGGTRGFLEKNLRVVRENLTLTEKKRLNYYPFGLVVLDTATDGTKALRKTMLLKEMEIAIRLTLDS